MQVSFLFHQCPTRESYTPDVPLSLGLTPNLAGSPIDSFEPPDRGAEDRVDILEQVLSQWVLSIVVPIDGWPWMVWPMQV